MNRKTPATIPNTDDRQKTNIQGTERNESPCSRENQSNRIPIRMDSSLRAYYIVYLYTCIYSYIDSTNERSSRNSLWKSNEIQGESGLESSLAIDPCHLILWSESKCAHRNSESRHQRFDDSYTYKFYISFRTDYNNRTLVLSFPIFRHRLRNDFRSFHALPISFSLCYL